MWLQCLSKKFYQWKCRIASLAEQRATIPPLQCDMNKLLNQSLNLKALCSLETTDVCVVIMILMSHQVQLASNQIKLILKCGCIYAGLKDGTAKYTGWF